MNGRNRLAQALTRPDRKPAPILRIAIPSPVRRCFDYWAPSEVPTQYPRPGVRILVPFRGSTRVGVIVAVAEQSDIPQERLKRALKILDNTPILPLDVLELLQWSSRYYHHPIGEVFRAVLPGPLRRGRATTARAESAWHLTERGVAVSPSGLRRAPRQAAVLAALQAHPQHSVTKASLSLNAGWRQALAALERKGWVRRAETVPEPPLPAAEAEWTLEPAQEATVKAITSVGNRFRTILLEGVTGSGKTEVYLKLIAGTVRAGRQALMLLPEIGLTPQTVARFRRRLSIPVQLLHSGLTEQERLRAWTMSRDGRVSVIIGTRSAAFVPLKNPGIFIVDEEHDVSYKQQDGFRYSARDIVVMRGRQMGIPVVLGSATPSLESLYNATEGRYGQLRLTKRAGGASAPSVEIVDLRGRAYAAGLSDTLLQAIKERLGRAEQCLLFINRRGHAPLMMCHTCGWTVACIHCDSRMVYHRTGERLRCHHCGAARRVPEKCAACGNIDLRILGTGTQRVVEALGKQFPDARIGRIDRDSIARKGVLEATLSSFRTKEINILVGTQMLTKGHDFPAVTLVGILDADQGLFGSDFRSTERLGQLIVQVAGRAGRGDKPGTVIIQTHHPTHPLLKRLIAEGYPSFAKLLLAERAEASLPPYTALALVRAETTAREAALAFLAEAKRQAQSTLVAGIDILGPVPAPMEKRGGRYRAHLLVHAAHRGLLHRQLRAWIPRLEALKAARRVRWSVDVDPQVML